MTKRNDLRLEIRCAHCQANLLVRSAPEPPKREISLKGYRVGLGVRPLTDAGPKPKGKKR